MSSTAMCLPQHRVLPNPQQGINEATGHQTGGIALMIWPLEPVQRHRPFRQLNTWMLFPKRRRVPVLVSGGGLPGI